MQRDQLAVEVALRDGVAVHEGERADARAHQRFRRERAHPADAEHRDVRGAQRRPALLAEQRDLAHIRLLPVHTAPPVFFFSPL